MGLAAIIRSGVATANKVTGGSGGLQAIVLHNAWTGKLADGYGTERYAGNVERRALVEFKQRMIKTSSGQLLMSRATVTFLEPIEANGATGRQEPIDSRDVITLPDGTTGPILDISGFVNNETNAPYFSVVSIG
jgi:hypothetical protein